VVELWGRHWSRQELLARVGRLDQIAGVQLTEAADGAERGVRLPGYLQPGEQRHYKLEVGALNGPTAIDDFASQASRLAELSSSGVTA
jgi:hypothetical protein